MNERNGDNLRIDVGGVESREQLHALLSGAFGFPDYYGMNWDAFDECIRDVNAPGQVVVSGIESLRRKLPREAELFLKCLRGFSAERSGRTNVSIS